MTFRRNDNVHDILPQDVFWAIIQHERARADRNFGGFSLIVATVGDDALSVPIRRVARAISNRKRQIDCLGWIDRCRVGVVLPNTTKDGAEKMATDLSRIFNQEKIDIAISKYFYPTDWLPEFDTDDENKHDDPKDRPNPPYANAENSLPGHDGSLGNLFETLYAWRLPWWKRCLDILGSTAILALTCPLMLLVALYIKAVSPGPCLYRQERIGQHGKPFMLLKFRTMRQNANADQHRSHLANLIHSERSMNKLDDERDPRIIPFGRFLRSFGIDELPQLINILVGHMSLIGPRPALGYEVAQYHLWHKRRLDAVPGLTGLWQVSGKNETTFRQMIRFDIEYARHVSPWLDIKILLKTLPAVFNQGMRSLLKRKAQRYAKNN